MPRSYYTRSVNDFIEDHASFILGELERHHEFALEVQQKNSWLYQIKLLKVWLAGVEGNIVFEYTIPRMGRRIDCVLLVGGIIFAIEFKVGSSKYDSSAIDQVVDYALDLKNFHEQSHTRIVVPILICTEATTHRITAELSDDRVAKPSFTNGSTLLRVIEKFVDSYTEPPIVPAQWISSVYKPTPTIIEAAQALYNGHSVNDISRSDAGAINLSLTSTAISAIIQQSKRDRTKSICFLTGVPGAGKTLAGLNLASGLHNSIDTDHAVFLSGNGPLVAVLQEALARNKALSTKSAEGRISKTAAIRETKAFIQNVHHFRDYLINTDGPPIDRVVVFDEAQRAWTLGKTADFMRTKKGHVDFKQSEPEFLIGGMDRHPDWATIICLVGGGQEINTGEAGLHEWFDSLRRSYPSWQIHVSSRLVDQEYTRGRPLYGSTDMHRINVNDDLHLAVSMRSFRSEKVSAFVKALLDIDFDAATLLYSEIRDSYPIAITRELVLAKKWLREKARGTERSGLLASSGALRLKPYGIHVKADMDPVNWFLNGKSDIRSSYFLEDVATEFAIQGLELDWTCVAWDADMRFEPGHWNMKSFRGTAWQTVHSDDARMYLKNAYRVLLTRARQGMVVFVPKGRKTDVTRLPEFYDQTYDYLRSVGIPALEGVVTGP